MDNSLQYQDDQQKLKPPKKQFILRKKIEEDIKQSKQYLQNNPNIKLY